MPYKYMNKLTKFGVENMGGVQLAVLRLLVEVVSSPFAGVFIEGGWCQGKIRS